MFLIIFPYMDTPVLVRQWLEDAGLSASAVARRAGVSTSTMHRVLNGLVDPSIGTLEEIAIACNTSIDLTTRPMSEPFAAAAARAMLEDGYKPPVSPGVDAWLDRLMHRTDSDDPVAVLEAAARASSPLRRPGAALFTGDVSLGRLASAGDASRGAWAISGPAGLDLPALSTPAPQSTLLWVDDAKAALSLLADSALRPTHRPDRATVAVLAAEPELFEGAFNHGPVRYAAPIQILLDCIAQGGNVADRALAEARSW